MRFRIAAVVSVLMLVATAALAQSDRGTVTGTVTDPQGAAVLGAAITLLNVETGSRFATQANETGNYSITSVPVGTYGLHVEHTGFRKFSQTGVRVGVAQTIRLDVSLTVGSTTEAVTVYADASLLKTESAEQSTVITADKIDELPLKFYDNKTVRNVFSFASLSPGVIGSTTWDIQVNGLPIYSFRIVLEGQDTGSSLGPGSFGDLTPSLDAIGEFTLQSGTFAAEYGQVGAGLLNMTAKSGTNQLHGSAYEIMVNEAFNAATPFTHQRPVLRQHDFGGNVGGPVWIPKIYNGRNRTFFFFNIEKFANTRMVYSLSSVPSNAYRNGDFSWTMTGRQLGTDGLGRPIMEGVVYDPKTDRRETDGRIYRDPFPANRMPISRFDPVAVKIQNLLPTPNLNVPGDLPVRNHEIRFPASKYQHVPSFKVDHNLGSNTKLSGYYHWNSAESMGAQDGLSDLISRRKILRIVSHTVRLNWDQTLSPTLLNHLSLGMQHLDNRGTTAVTNYDQMKELGLRGGLVHTFPQITGAFRDLGPMADIPAIYRQEKPSVAEALTWIRGKHTYKFGGEFRLDTFSNRNLTAGIGAYNFAGAQTGLPATQGMNLQGGSVGYSYASFLLGLVNTGSIGNPSDPMYRRKTWGFYAQDTFKIGRKLTLDYGLRWDYEPFWRELYDRVTQWDPNVVNPAAGGLKGGTVFAGKGPGRCNCDFTKTYPFAFGPRLGLAYQLTPKTVLRAGWGINYGATKHINYLGGASALGFGWNSMNFSNPAFGMPAFQFQNGLNYDVTELLATHLDPGIRPSPGQLNSPPSRWDPNAGRPPRLQNWSIGIQREVTKDLMVEANYVGNRGVWWEANGLVNDNALSPAMLQARGLNIANADDRAVLTSRLDSAVARARGFQAPYAGYPMSATVAQSLRPFPQFGGLAVSMAPLGNTWYDSLQARATKRLSHGLSFGAAYTWSKNLSTLDGSVNDVFNRGLAKSITTTDMPHLLVANGTWKIPTFGLAKRNYLTRLGIGGWTLGAILRYGSGTPIDSPGATTNLNALLFQGTKMNRVAGEPLFTHGLNSRDWDPNKEFVLNPNAWANPDPGAWGTAAARYSDYRTARTTDEQISLTKAFTLKEGISLNVRFELFNAFNRVQLPAPASDNPLAVRRVDASGATISGYGRINAPGTGGQRSGQLVIRLRF